MKKEKTVILGAGVTGLAAGYASGLPIYEAKEVSGGICSSYYITKTGGEKTSEPPKGDNAYRFEIGGGHWIFGGDKAIIHFINKLAPCKTYARKASIYLPQEKIFTPYPIQNHLRFLPEDVREKALAEMVQNAKIDRDIKTMAEWLELSFGKTLCDLFFHPFHKLYTAHLWNEIAPQDSYKSPVNLKLAIKGAHEASNAVGYNTTFIYPEKGLNELTKKLAKGQDIRYGKKVSRIDTKKHVIYFQKGEPVQYKEIISTLPLNKMLRLTGIETAERHHPSPGVLVLNMGAEKGPSCPKDHWVYIPSSNANFHRVGFYSNVDVSFLPKNEREKNRKVSIYVEKAYQEGTELSDTELKEYTDAVVAELQSWGWIRKVDVTDPTWIEVAYTWSWPGSAWKEKSIEALEEKHIYQIGRFGRWLFQGISDSIRDGLAVGGAWSD